MKSKLILNIAICGLLVTLSELMINSLLNFKMTFPAYGWNLISNLLLAGTLSIYTINSRLNGYKLVIACFIISYGIGSLNILVEALIFNVTTVEQTLNASIQGVVKFSVFSIVLAYFKKDRIEYHDPKMESRSGFKWLWRILLCILLYVVFYITAGMILQSTFPPLIEFYKDKLPSFGLIINTQFLRGLIFSGIGILLLNTCTLNKYNKAITLGLIFSVFGGLAPLIPPNEFMPLNIRLGHGLEVGISNFIYGLLIGLILNQNKLDQA